jgi:hypothetical protein
MNALTQPDPVMAPASANSEVRDLIARYFQAFDDKDWPTMRDCLCDEVTADYSLSRDLLGGMLSADLYVERCRFTLQVGDLRHTFFNVRIGLDVGAALAEARCNYIIHRLGSPPGGVPDHFNAYGHYEFGVLKENADWKLSRITQTVLRNRQSRTDPQRVKLTGSTVISRGYGKSVMVDYLPLKRLEQGGVICASGGTGRRGKSATVTSRAKCTRTWSSKPKIAATRG